jgi:elongation factor 1 alpha-like protein
MAPKAGHSRAKNIDYDDDDLYSEEDEYYEEDAQDDGMTEEDKEQMRIGTAKVKEALGSSLKVTDAQIQEALWHYFYDVGKSVSYLKSMEDPALDGIC